MVHECNKFATHQPIQVRLNAKKLWKEGWKVVKKPILAQLFEEDVAEKYKEANNDDEDLKENQHRQQEHQKLKDIMDTKMEQSKLKMDEALRKSDTTKHWKIWSSTVEEAFRSYWGINENDKEQSAQYKGRGKVVVQKAKPPMPDEVREVTTSSQKNSAEGHKARRQARRCGQLAARIKCLDNEERQHRKCNISKNMVCAAAVYNRLGDDDMEKELKVKMNDIYDAATNSARYPLYRRAEIHFDKKAEKLLLKYRAEAKKSFKEACEHKKTGIIAMSRALKTAAARPLVAVEIPEEEQEHGRKGTYATEPSQIDRIVREAWGKVYAGNFEREGEQTAAFLNKYQEQIFKSEEVELEDITAEQLKESCVGARKSVGGLDNWTPADFALLSDGAFQQLANMLNKIEAGAEWPRGMAVAKAAFLAKDPNKLEDPLAYRVLLILPTLYRRWASTRLRAMESWIEKWAMPEMFAGIKGKGAADGWYETALEFELANMEGDHVTGAAADVHKCFDQIQRKLVYGMAE